MSSPTFLAIFRSLSVTAIRQLFSSFTSIYSTTPCRNRSLIVIVPTTSPSMCACAILGIAVRSFTMIIRRHTFPPSVAMCTALCPWCMYSDTNSPACPCLRIVRSIRMKYRGRVCTPMMLPLRSTRYDPMALISLPVIMFTSSTPRSRQRRSMGKVSSSVVMWAKIPRADT